MGVHCGSFLKVCFQLGESEFYVCVRVCYCCSTFMFLSGYCVTACNIAVVFLLTSVPRCLLTTLPFCLPPPVSSGIYLSRREITWRPIATTAGACTSVSGGVARWLTFCAGCCE